MNYLLLLAVPAGNSHDNIILFQLWLGHDQPPASSCISGMCASILKSGVLASDHGERLQKTAVWMRPREVFSSVTQRRRKEVPQTAAITNRRKHNGHTPGVERVASFPRPN
jgi:hypothetical protein